ncbi:MAG TPA: hypothetical protein VKE95_07085 [Burkholderiales bacterium]|nr:hypothetical protein [Burkholderiales bacterium]
MSETYELDLRHRARVNESIPERHDRFMGAMARFAPPWGLKGLDIPPARDVKPGELSTLVKFRGLAPKGEMSYVKYPLRSEKYLRDNAQYDDQVIIVFKSVVPAERLRELFDEVLPAYIEAFGCYRATVYDSDIRMTDWKRVVELCASTGKDVDGRDGAYRIHPASFWDRELCRRAFGLAPENIVERLQGKAEKVSQLDDGVLLVSNSKIPLPPEEYEKLNARVKPLLT